MLFALTNTQPPATDLGFLLHEHPDRAQRYNLSFGAAHVFYPEAGEARCTACLLVDVDRVRPMQSYRPHPLGEGSNRSSAPPCANISAG
jgi:hypothetical protein